MRVVQPALLAFVAAAALFTQHGWAQGGGPPVPSQAQSLQPLATGYTVSGRVVCADTQRAARFAQVELVPAAGSSGGFDRGRRSSARTDLDGNFQIPNVATGDYYVTSTLAGYINEEPDVQAALSAGGDALNAISGVPMVHVTAGGASVQLSLQRGAVLAGTVAWDDGSPAGGVAVSAVPNATSSGGAGAQQTGIGPGFGPFGRGGLSSTSDDRGRFRIAGISPGAYLVRASVQAPVQQQGSGFTRNLNLFVYAPDKLRRTDAASITVAAGEERADVAVTLGLAGLHSVSGQVGATGGTVRSGTVSLTDQSDGSLNRTGYIGPDGSFSVTYVPPGNYTMRVNASSQAPGGFGRGGGNQTGSASSGRFQPVQESLTVGDADLTGISVNVTAAASSQ